MQEWEPRNVQISAKELPVLSEPFLARQPSRGEEGSQPDLLSSLGLSPLGRRLVK